MGAPVWRRVMRGIASSLQPSACWKIFGSIFSPWPTTTSWTGAGKASRTTRELLGSLGAQTVGAGADCVEARRPAIVERNGIRLGFLGYAKPGEYSCRENRPGAAKLVLDEVRNDIAALRPQVDHVILLLHWGIEFCDYPYPDDVALGRALIDAGASVIFGCHAHVIQGIEQYRHGLIFYGLGNFIYDPKGERIFVNHKLKERSECIIAQVSLSREAVIGFDYIPCRIAQEGCVEILMGEDEQAIRQRVKAISIEIGNASLVYATAAGNLLERELKTHLFYLQRDGLPFIWRAIRNLKWRHFRFFVGHIVSRLSRNFKFFNNSKM